MALLTTGIDFIKGVGSLRTWEKLIPWVWHPEQVLSREPNGQKMYDFVMNLASDVRQQERPFHEIVNKLHSKHGLKTDEEKNAFFQLLEWPTYMKRAPSPDEVARFSPNIRKAVIEHLETVTDPIWQTAKEADPSIGYLPGYFTHYLPSVKRVMGEEMKRIGSELKSLEGIGDPVSQTARQRLTNQLDLIKSKMSRISKVGDEFHLDEILTPQRYGVLQKGGYYGPMNEHRRAMKALGLTHGYEEIMHDYINNAFRKIYLDKLMPAVKPFFSETLPAKLKEGEALGLKGKNLMEYAKSPYYIKDDQLRTYAYDYIQAQRGTLGAKSKVNFNSALKSLFPNTDDERLLTKAVDEVTRFQYLAKIGISPRYPLVHATKSLLTTFPIVGGKVFWKAFQDAFNLDTWKRADTAGFIFKPTISRAVSEYYGRPYANETVQKILETITAPATFSERFDRVVTYAAGEHMVKKLGLSGKASDRYIQKLMDTTQFRYFREAMPLIVSGSAMGRVVYQFKTFTANYVNYLSKLYRGMRAGDTESRDAFVRAMGTFMVLAGTTHLPLWDTVRGQLLKRAGVDIGSFNPSEWATEQLGIVPGIDPRFFMHGIVSDVYSLMGPTIGPPVQFYFDVNKDPDRAWDHLGDLLNRISAPATSFLKPTLFETGMEARARTPAHPEGKPIGIRSPWELASLRPRLESVRHRYIDDIANARLGGREDLVRDFMKEARMKGIYINEDFMTRVNALVTKRRRPLWGQKS